MINIDISPNVIEKVADEFGTPLICFEHEQIEKWYTVLKQALPSNVTLVYSLKAGPNPYLVLYLNEHNVYFETASEGELEYLLDLGINPNHIIVSGQGKTIEYILLALKNNITQYNIESINELEMLRCYKNSEIKCNIRVNPNFTNNRSSLKMGGISSAFGIDENLIYDTIKNDAERVITGIFMYAGSQFFYANDIAYNTNYLLELCIKLYERTGRKFHTIDFGGGFGVPEDNRDGEINSEELCASIHSIFAKHLNHEAFSDVEAYFFESGRYLSARTAVLVTRVLDIKESRGRVYAITDIGINSLGVKQAEYRIYPPIIKGLKQTIENHEYVVVGRTCTPIDITHPCCILPKLSVGDVLYILDCGGYSLTFSPNNFCGLSRPAEVVHVKGNFLLTNRREFPEEVYGRTVTEQLRLFQQGSGLNV